MNKAYLILGIMILLMGINFVNSVNYPNPFVNAAFAEMPECSSGQENYYDEGYCILDQKFSEGVNYKEEILNNSSEGLG